jgi:hypothetical protein
MEPEFKTVEITIKFTGDDYKNNREVYAQRLNFDWYFNNRPTLIQQIIAVVNDLEFPLPKTLGSWQEVK